jgi:hypothetical protein
MIMQSKKMIAFHVVVGVTVGDEVVSVPTCYVVASMVAVRGGESVRWERAEGDDDISQNFGLYL